MMRLLDFVVQLPFSYRQRRVRALRDDMNRERFVSTLAKNETEKVAAGLLWDKLVEVAVIPDFRPSPEDDFLYIYGLADEDLDEDIILSTLITIGRPLPSPAVLQQVGEISSPREFMELLRQIE